MAKRSQEKFTPTEIFYLILALAVVIASLIYVPLAKLNTTPNDISVSFSNFDGGYDVSVINNASYEDFMQVSGIGEVKASAIIAFRDSLGGFDNVYQLNDLSTLNAQNFEDIIMHFYFNAGDTPLTESEVNAEPDKALDNEVSNTIDSPLEAEDIADTEEADSVRIRRQVNINTASAIELSECLLINITAAEQIVSVREQLGGYDSVLEVLLCDLITEEIYAQILDYILL